jgi:hypothetical protein
MKDRVDEEIVRYLWWLRPVLGDEAAPPVRRPAPRRPPPLILNDPSTETASLLGGGRAQAPQANPFGPSRSQQAAPPRVGGDDATPKTVRRDEPKVGRNDPCPCGSGKKYKKCHGATA